MKELANKPEFANENGKWDFYVNGSATNFFNKRTVEIVLETVHDKIKGTTFHKVDKQEYINSGFHQGSNIDIESINECYAFYFAPADDTEELVVNGIKSLVKQFIEVMGSYFDSWRGVKFEDIEFVTKWKEALT